MPPAFVLSQDQTLKFVSRYSRHEAKTPPTANTELQEPIPALVKRNGYEGQCDIDLNNPYTEPEAPRTGRRRPHVPSSKTDNVKDLTKQIRRTTNTPRSCRSEELLSVYVGDR